MKNNRNLIVIMAISLPFILAIFGSCKTSSNSTSKNKQANRMEMCQENNDIITLPEVLPSFPGGETAKKKYLTENIKCPKYTNKQQIQGRIIAAFIVEKDGSLSNITILQGVGGDCDEEVLEIIKKMPRWNPGFCFGEPVRVQYNMAVLFELEKSKNNIPDYLLEGCKYINDVMTVAEEMPNYPGGDMARMKFLQENIKYPQMARESGIQGTVYVTFVVEKDGSLSNIAIMRGIGGGCDAEVLRLIYNMPRWNPGRCDGEPVRVRFNMPVKFTLTRKKE